MKRIQTKHEVCGVKNKANVNVPPSCFTYFPKGFITSSFTCNIKIVMLWQRLIKNPKMQWFSKIDIYFSLMLTVQGR